MNFVSLDRIYPRDPKIPSHEPWKSPTLYGPTFAIWKEFFEHIGYLDSDFDIWGGEEIIKKPLKIEKEIPDEFVSNS